MVDSEGSQPRFSPELCYKLKVVVVGDGASGKTSLITKYTQDHCGKQYVQTVGLDFFNREVIFADRKPVLLQIWDIGGQTLGGSMLDKYVFGADIVLLVYDITNRNSYENIQDWITTVEPMVHNDRCFYGLVGNKVDLEHIRVVTKQEHEQFAKENEMGSFFISAKTGESVNAMFKRAAAQRLKIKLPRRELEATTVVKANVYDSGSSIYDKNTPASTSFVPQQKSVISKMCLIQ